MPLSTACVQSFRHGVQLQLRERRIIGPVRSLRSIATVHGRLSDFVTQAMQS